MSLVKQIELCGNIYDVYFVDGEGNDYFEVYDSNGNCLNEGELLFQEPDENMVAKLLD